MDDYVSYDYKKIPFHSEEDLQFMDALKCFGWEFDEEIKAVSMTSEFILRRPKEIMHKTELIRLEKNLVSCWKEIKSLYDSVHHHAFLIALSIGIIGTIFMAGSTFSIVNDPPLVTLCVILAIPGFIGWILPCIVYKRCKVKRAKKIVPYVEREFKEIDIVCKKALHLLHA